MWTHVVDHWWKGVLASYTLEYAISTYSCLEVADFEFLWEPRLSFLRVIPLAMKILVVTLGLEAFPMTE